MEELEHELRASIIKIANATFSCTDGQTLESYVRRNHTVLDTDTAVQYFVSEIKGDNPNSLLDAIRKPVKDKKALRKMCAIAALGILKSEKGSKELAYFLVNKNVDPNTRFCCAGALVDKGEYAGPVKDILVERLFDNSEDNVIRERCAETLGKLLSSADEITPQILKLLSYLDNHRTYLKEISTQVVEADEKNYKEIIESVRNMNELEQFYRASKPGILKWEDRGWIGSILKDEIMFSEDLYKTCINSIGNLNAQTIEIRKEVINKLTQVILDEKVKSNIRIECIRTLANMNLLTIRSRPMIARCCSSLGGDVCDSLYVVYLNRILQGFDYLKEVRVDFIKVSKELKWQLQAVSDLYYNNRIDKITELIKPFQNKIIDVFLFPSGNMKIGELPKLENFVNELFNDLGSLTRKTDSELINIRHKVEDTLDNTEKLLDYLLDNIERKL
jgi:hypothetical protein